jgi:uncharacterized membrane protein YqjE
MITDENARSAAEDDAEHTGPQDERGWGDRLADVAAQAGELLKTRLEIFREEAAEKAAHAARGAAGMAIAIGLATGAILLFAAFLAAVLAKLLGSVPLGILAAFVLYAAAAGLFGWRASKALAQVKPGEFPATREELRRDAEALQAALSIGGDEEADEEAAQAVRGGEAEVEDLEARFREGSE